LILLTFLNGLRGTHCRPLAAHPVRPWRADHDRRSANMPPRIVNWRRYANPVISSNTTVMPKRIDPQALKIIAADVRDLRVSDDRAAQLAQDVARINDAARAEGAKNDFNAQPSNFALTLANLARKAKRVRR